jgi:hypothetical protein
VTKITLSVCKVYKNTGRFRFHRKKTKPAWKHYFIDLEDETFGTEWVSAIKAIKLKLNIWKKRKAYCFECQNIFDAYIKNDKDQVECPYCP